MRILGLVRVGIDGVGLVGVELFGVGLVGVELFGLMLVDDWLREPDVSGIQV